MAAHSQAAGDALSEQRVQLQGAYTVGAMRELVGSWRLSHQTIALVPTMGNLHPGHLSLTRLARAHADKVICSIFVNPAQFGRDEDFSAYPRTLTADEALLESQGLVNVVFAPEVEEVYPFGVDGAVTVQMPALAQELCGASRPGHFNGVASVVLRLLNIVAPDVLVLGQKDYQQLILLQRMVADLQLPIQVVSGPIQRELDGLAMSSRNQYLTSAERALAPRLHAALERLGAALKSGDHDYATLEAGATRSLTDAGFRPDYVEVRRAIDLGKPNGAGIAEELVVVAAAWLGRARLIDNVRV